MQPRRQEPAETYEPVIGVDIGVPSPARRIKTDPAAQTRSMVIAIVAVAAVIGVVLLAYIISSLGGDDSTPNGPAENDATDQTTTAVGDSTPSSSEGQSSGLDVTPGIVPDLIGVQEAVARLAIAEAGYVVSEFREPNSQPKGTVINQSPAPDVEYAAGSTVRIVISEGP